MAKIGRNNLCPCGSGKKYKHCCLEKDEAAERKLAAAASAPPRLIGDVANIAARLAPAYDIDDTEDELTSASNAAVELIDAGKLDEAERAARDLIERFPDVHDGWDRLGLVYEVKGDYKKAADCYRKVIDFIRAHPNDYDPGFEAAFHKLVERLDPSAPA
jgi:tetratricopeptide (TPR) repeat protein